MESDPAPTFAPGELEEITSLVHLLFAALPSTSAELVLRACWRSKWPAHLVHALELALRQAEWRERRS